jgi:hypothetical protein
MNDIVRNASFEARFRPQCVLPTKTARIADKGKPYPKKHDPQFGHFCCAFPQFSRAVKSSAHQPQLKDMETSASFRNACTRTCELPQCVLLG